MSFLDRSGTGLPCTRRERFSGSGFHRSDVALALLGRPLSDSLVRSTTYPISTHAPCVVITSTLPRTRSTNLWSSVANLQSSM